MKVKVKISTSDYITIILFVIGSIIALYQNEIKNMITIVFSKWQLILFVICVIGLFSTIIKIWFSNKLESEIRKIKKEEIESFKKTFKNHGGLISYIMDNYQKKDNAILPLEYDSDLIGIFEYIPEGHRKALEELKKKQDEHNSENK